LRQVATDLEDASRATMAPWPTSDVRASGSGKPRKLTGWQALATAAAGAAIFLALHIFAGPRRDIAPSLDLTAVAIALGLGIEKVTIAGHRHTSDAAIFEMLDASNIRTQLDLDPQAVKARIERLPWIAAASVARVLPDGVAISVVERRAAVVWRHDGREWLIDATGRRLGENPPGAFAELHRITGLGADTEAPELLKFLAEHPEIARRLDRAERVSGRRWTLHLMNGTQVLLPADNASAALARASTGRSGTRPIDRAAAIVDLRSPTRIIVGAAR
jgi:cell division protein FtsQ